MLSLTFWKQIMFTAMIVTVISVPALASTSIIHIFNYVLEPVQELKSAGMTDLELVVYPYEEFNPENKLTEITVSPLDNLQYSGEMTWTVNASKENPYRTILTVVIPPKDTSGIRIELRCGRFYWKFERHFVSYDDSIIVFQVDPRHIIPPFPTQPRKGPRVGWWIPGEFPIRDSLEGPPIPPFDTTSRSYHITNTEEELARKRIRKLERKPLEHIGSQVIFVGDEAWTRKRGETKFRKLNPAEFVGVSDARGIDSTSRITMNEEKEVCLILESDAQIRTARDILGTLKSVGKTGYYHQSVSWQNLKRLDSAEIRVIFLDIVPHEHPSRDSEI